MIICETNPAQTLPNLNKIEKMPFKPRILHCQY